MTLATCLLVTALLQLALSTHTKALLNKRTTTTYKVEGCFSSFSSSGGIKRIQSHNSNVRCQNTCREEGYAFAATKGRNCHCGNVYPKGYRVKDNKCTTRCRYWTPCYVTQSCCGGRDAYSVSVVGNIDVAKQVLRRLSHEWQKNTYYRYYLKKFVKISYPKTSTANWIHSMDREGWSVCGRGKYMTGMWRNDYKEGDERIGRIEYARCREAPMYLYPRWGQMDCYNHNWWHSFNRKGWSKCNNGYYMTGLYTSDGDHLGNIEEARCCRPYSQEKQWGQCYSLHVWSAFDRRGWSKCKSEYYMVGLYKNHCDRLGCIEIFRCCRMGTYNRDSWIEKPNLFIKVKDTSGNLKKCSMNAMDTTETRTSYQCWSLSDRANMLVLNAVKFNIQDKKPLNDAGPERISIPVICSAFSQPYKCSKSINESISTSYTFEIGSWFALGVKIGASVGFSANYLGSGLASIFLSEVTKLTSFNVQASKKYTKKKMDTAHVSVQVPANKELKISYLRTVHNFEYRWTAVFELLGKYSVKWANGQEIFQDVTTVLTGSKREMHAFGSWIYPDNNVPRVVITDKHGKEMDSECEDEAAETLCVL